MIKENKTESQAKNKKTKSKTENKIKNEAKAGQLVFSKMANYPGLVQGVFDRSFGNVSFKHGNRGQVLTARRKISRALAIDLTDLWEMDQVHGSCVAVLNQQTLTRFKNKARQSDQDQPIRVDQIQTVGRADGMVTDRRGVFLMVKTADCFPVLFYDPFNQAVGAVHVGWRGAVEKIFFNCLLKMINNYNTRPKQLIVAIGPGIGPGCFKHQRLVQDNLPEWRQYINQGADQGEVDQTGAGSAIDLKGFIKAQLIEAGIRKENIEAVDWCTSCSEGLFSHFRSLQGKEEPGSFATIIGLRKKS